MSNSLDHNTNGQISRQEIRSCLLPFLKHFRDLDKLVHLQSQILKKIELALTKNFLDRTWRQKNGNNNIHEASTEPALPEKTKDL